MCNNSSLLGFLTIVKRMILLIQIIVPIILIIFVILSFIKLINNPDDNKLAKKIINQFLAAIFIFFIPLLVNGIMDLVGEKTNFSSCWNSAPTKISLSQSYKDITDNIRKKINPNSGDYEPGRSNLDFSCTSEKVKAQFSCATLEIVEKHLYDFDATNFHSVINNKYGGSFKEYAESLGGIFGEYYGKKMPNQTETDFQLAAEYVIGWMYMYGWDYMNDSGQHASWIGKDAFYANGGFVGKFILDPNTSQYSGIGTNFDNIISGKNGGVGRMASECGDLEMFIYNKLGISRDKQLPKVTKLRDLKVGDCIYFFNHRVDKSSEQNWGIGTHNVVVGEVYEDRIVCYDAGSYYQNHKNYKRTIKLPNTYSEESDYNAIKKTFGYNGWGMRRFYNFEG